MSSPNPVYRIKSVSYISKQPVLQPKTVRFPDMINKTKLRGSKPIDTKKIKEALENIRRNKIHFSSPITESQEPFHLIHFNYEKEEENCCGVKIPRKGNFKLVFKKGTKFKIKDNDATDGVAELSIPEGLFKTYIKLSETETNSSYLKIEDELYHVQDKLKSSRLNQWSILGERPIPIPKNWYSEDNEKFVLNFKSQGLRSFHLLLIRSKNQIPIPLGTKKISVDGGVVELPGVATLSIPKGALTGNRFVTLKQVKQAFNPATFLIGEGTQYEKWEESYTYISSLIKLEPQGLALRKPAKIRIKNLKPFPHHSSLIMAVSMNKV